MTEQEWFAYYDEHKNLFQWFMEKVTTPFGNAYQALELARIEERQGEMMSMMNHVWFILPDNQFNILVNPKGWNEFLHLIES